jgi:hypothetical protein
MSKGTTSEERLYNNKYNVFLIMLNDILKNIKKESYVEIENISDFKDICAFDIKTDENEAVFANLEKEILCFYSRQQLRHTTRKMRLHYIFSAITFMAEDLGYEFIKTKTKYTKIGTKNTVYVYYSIVRRKDVTEPHI